MANLRVQAITFAEDDRGILHFWGEVTNEGEVPQRWVKVTVRLVGADDQVKGDATDMVGLEWIAPHASAPFHFAFQSPPVNWSHYLMSVDGADHDFTDPNVPQPHLHLDVGRTHYREIERAGLLCSIVGQISNNSKHAASHVKVSGTLYGAGGQVVGALSPYLVPKGTFGPGQQMTFELKYYALGGPVTNYRVEVQGHKVLEG
jgi:hypothetical protein